MRKVSVMSLSSSLIAFFKPEGVIDLGGWVSVRLSDFSSLDFLPVDFFDELEFLVQGAVNSLEHEVDLEPHLGYMFDGWTLSVDFPPDSPQELVDKFLSLLNDEMLGEKFFYVVDVRDLLPLTDLDLSEYLEDDETVNVYIEGVRFSYED